MEGIYGWVKNLVCFYIFMTAVLHLLPKESYRKYVRFFTGLLLVILVLTPVLSLFQNKETLYEKISQAGFFQEADNRKLDTAYLEKGQRERCQKEYEKAIGVDVGRMAEALELSAGEVKVELDEEYQVEKIDLQVSLAGEGGSAVEKALFSGTEEYPAVHELKKELMAYYQIQEEQLEITVQGGRT